DDRGVVLLERVPRLHCALVCENADSSSILTKEPMKNHAEVGADILKTQIKGVLLKPRQASQRVHAVPQDQRAMFKLKQLRGQRMLRQGFQFGRKPSALRYLVHVEDQCARLSGCSAHDRKLPALGQRRRFRPQSKPAEIAGRSRGRWTSAAEAQRLSRRRAIHALAVIQQCGLWMAVVPLQFKFD